MSAAATMFGGTVVANVVIDPQHILGTGLLGPSHLPNDRYFRFKHYLAAADRYDGLAFGSSRGPIVPDETMSRHMRGATFATFSVYAGTISDHLAVLDYAVRTRGGTGNGIRAVFLLLDADIFGLRQLSNQAMHTLWHPVMMGEDAHRFKWRYVTAIQPTAWSATVRFAWSHWRYGTQPPRWVIQLAKPAVPPKRPEPAPEQGNSEANEASAVPPPAPEVVQKRQRVITSAAFVRARPDFGRQLALLRRFVEICRANDIKLVVALSPLHRKNAARFDPEELDVVAQMIGEIVPVWAFGSPAWLSERADWWHDLSHYTGAVQAMMMARIFGLPTARADFGRLIGRNGAMRQ
ncbi:MAG: hypothetical protein ACRECO_18790 [Xanthobacteraceae bacterium]